MSQPTSCGSENIRWSQSPPFGQLPPTIHCLASLHPAHKVALLSPEVLQSLGTTLMPSRKGNISFITINSRQTKILPRTLPNPPVTLLSPAFSTEETMTFQKPKIQECKSVSLTPILPPALPRSSASSLASLARKALLSCDAFSGDITPLAPGIWAVVRSANEGIVTSSTDIVMDFTTVPFKVSHELSEWVLHAWHSPQSWATEIRRKVVKTVTSRRNGLRNGVVGVTGCLPDVLTVIREFSVGRNLIHIGDAQGKGVMEAFAKAEVHGGVLVVPAGGRVEELTMQLLRQPREGDYLRNYTAGSRGVCILVVGAELRAAATEARAVVKVLPAGTEERTEIISRICGAQDDTMKELLQMTTGYGRDHVSGLSEVCQQCGMDACRESVRIFGSTLSIDTGGVRWDDIGGLDEAKEQILELLDMEDDANGDESILKGGLNRRVGVLLYGPPGTGKTLLARAVATEARCSFIAVKGPELFDMYVGESEKNVREVFQRAIDIAPCIIFFDEVDALAPNRGRGSDSGGVSDRIVSQLLAKLDEITAVSHVFVIGASNRPDLVDTGLLRPGRLDKIVYVPMPVDRQEQVKILTAQTKKFRWEGDIEFMEALEHAPEAPRLSGADLYALASRSWINAAERHIQQDGKVDGVDTFEDNDADKEIGAAREWACNINRIYRDWFRGESVCDGKYPVKALLDRDISSANAVVTVSQEDLVAAAQELAPSLSEVQLRGYEELRMRMQGS